MQAIIWGIKFKKSNFLVGKDFDWNSTIKIVDLKAKILIITEKEWITI